MIVKPVSREVANSLIHMHPHAPQLPAGGRLSNYCMAAYEGTEFIGLAVWGLGVRPTGTPNKLFGTKDTKCYLELNRFFCVDGVEKNTPSKFLGICHNLIKKHAKSVDWIFTYAAGFQGMIGHIYKASGYDYIGTTQVKFLWIPDVGLIHFVSLWHKYGKNGCKLDVMSKVYPTAKFLMGDNFCYIKILRNKEKWDSLAKYKTQPYPSKDNIKIWDSDGNTISPDIARHIPIIKLSKDRAHKV